MASKVEPPFVSAAENKGWLHSVPEASCLSKWNVGYAAWLFRPQAFSAPVAMTSPWNMYTLFWLVFGFRFIPLLILIGFTEIVTGQKPSPECLRVFPTSALTQFWGFRLRILRGFGR